MCQVKLYITFFWGKKTTQKNDGKDECVGILNFELS